VFQYVKKYYAVFALLGIIIFSFITLSKAAARILNSIPQTDEACPYRNQYNNRFDERFMRARDANGTVHCYKISCTTQANGTSWTVLDATLVRDNDCSSN